MSKAPERIWAFYAPEIEEDNPQCTIVAGDDVMYGSCEYIRADIHDALVKAADELYRQLDDVSDEAIGHDLIGFEWAGLIDKALAAYKQAKEKLNAI